MRPAKHLVQEFNGVKFYRTPRGYYKACHRHGGAYMHRYVWEYYNGPIPDGHQVHHKNHLRADCRIENLELLPSKQHAEYHGSVADKEYLRERMRTILQPLAAEWHRSEDGKAFHKALGAHSWKVRQKVTYTCAHCNTNYEAFVNVKKRGFCSAKCQSAARRASGVDDVEAKCAGCGGVFTKNKYSKQRYCGKSCAAKSKK